MSKRQINSPCVDVCKMDKLRGLCCGCLRTIAEIKAWKGLSRNEQKALLADLDDRRARLDQPLMAPDPCP